MRYTSYVPHNTALPLLTRSRTALPAHHRRPPLQPRRILRFLPPAPRAPLRALVPQLLRHDARLARADVMLGVSREPQLHLVARPRRVSSPEPLGSAARVASALPVVEVLRAHDDDDHHDDDDDGGGGEVGGADCPCFLHSLFFCFFIKLAARWHSR